jgi:hypothetical protein
MAKLFLDANDTFTVSDDVTIVGVTGGNEVIKISGTPNVQLDANIERVELDGNVADYTFQVSGTTITVLSGGVAVATLNGLNQTAKIAFGDGAADLALTGLDAATLGGTALATTAAAVVPTTIDAADTSGGSTGAGQAFTLTDSTVTGNTSDSVVGTSGDDTITGATGTLEASDVIVDQSTSDSDTLNVTMTATNGASTIQNIETINVSWDSFSAAAFDATNVSGASIAFDTTKAVHTTGTTITALGANNLNMGSVMAGTLTANGVSTAAINAGAYTTVTVNAVTDAPIATTLVANSATAINVDGDNASATEVAANTLDVTVGKDVTFTTEDIGVVGLTVGAAATVTLANGGAQNDIDTLTVNGASDIVLDAAEIMTAETITDATTAGTLTAKVSTNAVDASKWDSSIIVDIDNTAVNTITVDEAANVKLGVAANTVTISQAASTATTNTLAMTTALGTTSTTLANTKTATLAVDNSAGTLDLNALDTAGADITITASTDVVTTTGGIDLTFSTLDVATGSATITGTSDVDIDTTFEGVTLDASGLTGLLDVADTVDNDATTINGGSGKNVVQFATIDGKATYVGQDAGDTVVVDEIKGTSTTEGIVSITTGAGNDDLDGDVDAAGDFGKWTISSGAGNDTFDLATATTNNVVVLAMGEGNDTVTMDALTTSTISGSFGDGTDTLSLAAFTTGSLDVQMGAGNDSVTVNASGGTSIAANAAIVVDLGDGEDTLTIGEAAALDADVNLIVTGGTTGTDTVRFDTGGSGALDLTAANIVFTNVEQLSFDSGDTVNFSNAQLTGKDYKIAGVGGDAAVVEIDNTGAGSATTTDLSLLTFNTTAGTAVDAVTIQASAHGDTITGTNDAAVVDTITGGAGADTISGGNGNDSIDGNGKSDTMTGGLGDDTFVINAGDSTIANGIDHITDFVGGTDEIDSNITTSAQAVQDKTSLDLSAQSTLQAAATAAIADATVGSALDAIGDTGMFTYGGKTYLIENAGADSTFLDGTDLLVEITGYTGTIVVGDIV